MHWFNDFGGPWLMIFWWVIIIGAVIVIAKGLFFSSNRGPENQSALDILKKRYARGEIDKEEFSEKKKDILS